MNKTRVFNAAHIIDERIKDFALSLKIAWNAERLRDKLSKSVVRFSFIKASTNETRNVNGTTDLERFEYEFKGSTRKPNPSIISFFDMDKGEWRSTRIDRLVGVK